MLTVHRYVVPITDDGTFLCPEGGIPLSAGFKDHAVPGALRREFSIWVLVDPLRPLQSRRYWVRGTGHPITPTVGMKFIATLIDYPLVWHVFVETV